ncbi:MAG: choice-of-anchor J domain-containing protein [Bacteroidota bacterium]
MKKFLLSIGLLTAFGVSAQNYFTDDFSGGFGNWTLSDEDGDGFNWSNEDYGGAQAEVASSASWDSNAGALTPDNWMISQSIDLSGATGTIYLEWKAYAQDQNWTDEEYSVYVSTNNDVATLTSEGADFNEIVGASSGYVTRGIDVSSFAGSMIHVAFRHHNTTDQFVLNIDDVNVAQVPANDLELSAINVDSGLEGDRTFSIDVTNTGTNTVTDFDVEWNWDGGTPSVENVTGVSMAFGDVHTINVQVNGVAAGNGDFTAEITTADDVAANNTLSETFIFDVPVPQYVANDSYGEEFDLHAALSSGQAIVLDFMASWCGPCESSTPEISEFVENNGSGDENVEALAITVEQNDDAATLNGLDWNGGFYEYPKFPYSSDNNYQYYHYAVNHDFNSGGSIPFFVMICPNTEDPAYSTIVRNDVGYGQGMFGAYQTELDNCPSATAKLIQNDLEPKVNVYPNPATSNVTVDMELYGKTDVDVQLVNNLGQVVTTQHLNETAGAQSVQLNVDGVDAGIYMVKVKTANTETTHSISVVK